MVKNTPIAKFQSFLITGYKADRTKEVKNLFQSFGIDPFKSSPDVTFVTAEKLHISINQIRDIKRQINQKPILDKFKSILIEDAQKLTEEAQNSLLKIFEEPPKHAILVLAATDKKSLLPTIVSRAIIIEAQTDKKPKTKTTLLNGKSVEDLLKKTSTIDDPITWLDEQIRALYEKLQSDIQEQSREESISQIQKTLEKCIEAKKMIHANVNPKFVLANLIFSIYPEVSSQTRLPR